MTMLFFRSEAHVERWYAQNGRARGESFSRAQLWQLAQLWYGNRLDPAYSGRSLAEAMEIFSQVGLTSAFWQAA